MMKTSPRPVSPPLAAGLCAVGGFVVFQFFGNAGRGYIDTSSLFWWWGFQWFNPGSEAEHGPYILAASAWLAWRNLRASAPSVAESRFAYSWWAPYLAMCAALGLHAVGYLVDQARISILALLLFTWGVLALGGGRRWGRACQFPLGFLVFAIPLNVLDSVGFYLRLWVIDATTFLARAGGVEVIRNGTQLFAPDGSYQYDVAAACSGVRSLMALMALSLALAYLNLRSQLRRAAVFLLCLPLTYVGNVLRIGGIILAGEWLGQDAGLWVHAWAGFVVFGVVLGGVLAAISLLSSHWPEKVKTPSAALGLVAGEARPVSWIGLGGVLACIVAVVTWTILLDWRPVTGSAGVRLTQDGLAPVDLPVSVGVSWVGQRTEVTAVEREVLPPDTGFSRRLYVSTFNRQDQVFVSVVLSGRDRTSIHRPELCLVGQGWTVVAQRGHRFMQPNGSVVPCTLLRVEREVVDARERRRTISAFFAYWFVGDGVIEPTHGGRLWRTAVNRLQGRTDRWAYVVAQTLVGDESEEVALRRLQVVLDGVLPELIIGKTSPPDAR